MKTVRSIQPATPFERLFTAYLVVAVIGATAFIGQGFVRSVSTFLILMGLFGVGAAIIKRRAALRLRKSALMLGIFILVLGSMLFSLGKNDELPQVQAGSADQSLVQTAGAAEAAALPQRRTYPILGVPAGDTITITMSGRTETIRIIGIDAPEPNIVHQVSQCSGIESANRLRAFLAAKHVVLEQDAGQGDRDAHGRLLRTVLLEDGTNVAVQMIREGFAREYTSAGPYRYQPDHRAAERIARQAAAGVWSPLCYSANTPSAVLGVHDVAPNLLPAPSSSIPSAPVPAEESPATCSTANTSACSTQQNPVTECDSSREQVRLFYQQTEQSYDLQPLACDP